MLERNFGDNTAYTLTVDEMAGVYDMLEESHFPISVTFTFLAEWFESVRCFDTAEKIRELLDTYLEDENKLLKHMNCKCTNEEAEDEPYTDMRSFVPSRIAKSKEEIYDAMRLKSNDDLEGLMSAAEYKKLFKEAEALILKEEGENDES